MGVIDASAARTASGTGIPLAEALIDNCGKGLIAMVDVTALGGTSPTLTVRIQYTLDGVNWIDLDTTNGQTASITATGRSVLRVYPGLTATANAAVNSILPETVRFAWTIGGTTSPSFTFSTHAERIE